MLLQHNRWVEQIGEYEVTSPVMPKRSEFMNGDERRIAHQKFVRTELPAVFKKKNRSADEDDEVKAHYIREWKRRREGVWFYNCGQATYLTGVHYFYLCYNAIDIGFPDYRDSDRRFFWLWKHCEDDPHCFGLLYITRRQQGKSYKLGCILLEYASRVYSTHCGMQSKSDGDAKDFFQRTIVRAWKKLPFFFSPKFRNPNPPKTALEFFAPASNAKNSKLVDGSVDEESELESTLDFQSSQEEAYDGAKLGRYGRDEAFKEQRAEPMKAVSIVKRTMEQPIPGKGVQIIGKILVTSTIQEIEGAGVARARDAWNDADPKNRDANGHTVSGLNRYMQPSFEGHLIDEYGRDQMEESRLYFQNRRDQFIAKGQMDKYEAEVRANPFDIDEALEGRATECLFNAMHIDRNLKNIKKQPTELQPVFYDLVFNKDRSKVVAKRNDVNGKFLISWLPPKEMMNRVASGGTVNTKQGTVTRYRPKNDVQFAVGCDPYDKMVVTNNKRASNASAYGFLKYNPGIESKVDMLGYWPTHSFFVEYINRPAAPSIFYNDMILLCHWLGCKLHFENQKNNIEAYFEERGYGAFLSERPTYTHTENTKKQTAKGTPSSQLTKGFYADLLIEFVQSYVGFDEDGDDVDWRHCPFERLLEDWKKFQLDKTQLYDPTVASGFTLMKAMEHARPPVDSSSAGAILLAGEALYA